MTKPNILGHDDVAAQFRAMLARGRMPSTFLFVGPAGVGKHTFARFLAQALLCSERPAELLDPCGTCEACVQVTARTHPDLLEIRKPDDKSFIPLDLLIGAKERRMQEGLCHDISLKPFMGGRRVAIIDDADYLNEEGANSLLKTLEEPPPRSMLILIGTSADRQLPTIRSRAQIIRFRPLATELVANLLLTAGVAADRQAAERLAAISGGSVSRAAELNDPDLWRFRDTLLGRLADPAFDSVELSRTVAAIVDEAGKEAAARRARMRLLIGFTIEGYRSLLRRLAGAGSAAPGNALESAAAHFADVDVAALVDRSLEALSQVDRNANQSALIECWFDDLSQICALGTAAG